MVAGFMIPSVCEWDTDGDGESVGGAKPHRNADRPRLPLAYRARGHQWKNIETAF